MRFSAAYQIGLAKYRLINLVMGVYVVSLLPLCLLGTWGHVGVVVVGGILLDRLLWRALFPRRRR